jgi:hypothetical protein
MSYLNRDYKSQPDDLPTFYDFRMNEDVAKTGYKDNYSTIIFRYLLLEEKKSTVE